MTKQPTPEQCVVGALLIDREAVAVAARAVKPEHFDDQAMRAVYSTCLDLWRDGVGVDLMTVSQSLRRAGTLEGIGGYDALIDPSRRIASSAHLLDHCALVREDYSLRVIQGGARRASDPMNVDASEIISTLSADILKASLGDIDNDVNLGERAYSLLNEPLENRAKPIYLGMGPLDQYVFVNDGNIISISADAGVGKTAMMLSVILNLLPQRKAWVVSLEMGADELTKRALCQLAMVDIQRIMEGNESAEERDLLSAVASKYADVLSRMDIDDSGSMTIDEFMAKAEHKVRREDVGLIAIDYAQLMDYDSKQHRNKPDGLESISKGIRAISRKLRVPIIQIVHVNKSGEEHGSIQFEKDAHVRLKLTREVGAPTITVRILKNRNGKCTTVEVPCEMQWGIVGRNSPPTWCNGSWTPLKLGTPQSGVTAIRSFYDNSNVPF